MVKAVEYVAQGLNDRNGLGTANSRDPAPFFLWAYNDLIAASFAARDDARREAASTSVRDNVLSRAHSANEVKSRYTSGTRVSFFPFGLFR
jgi:hypothetical protein